MRYNIIACLGLMLVSVVLAGSPQTGLSDKPAQPASRATSTPAVSNDPKSVMTQFVKKGWEGDEQAILSVVYLPDDKARAEATKIVRIATAQPLWHQTVAEAFKGQYKPSLDPTYGAFDKSLTKAKIAITGG